ncbi:platelet endothelial cell adhesion molecule isoform X1 [Meriones unguiculatus]|uniref:platelet endothelial cell adhesion molecule isoform X1 n=1 Tax=Meriones unguiculatus TaxID=10047 RepID=UPI000B4F821B|nr:platelet endothelial cell adhesion molecule isoform X1 [Meriones unguiculatus]
MWASVCKSLALRMQLRRASVGKMPPALLLTLLLYASLQAQENSFTINSIQMEILPADRVPNGHNLTLQCLVDISTTSAVRPQHQVLFYKDDALVYNVSSREHTESFFIPQARVFHSGMYKCTVILNNKEKTTQEYQVVVQGVPNPVVTLDKKEVTEGGAVTVNCSVQEEKPPIYFSIEKVELDTKLVKQRREKNSPQNFVLMEFPIEEQDHVIVFRCQARILSGIQLQTSESTRSEFVTVQESFSTPKFEIQPSRMIIEGDQLHIKCTVQVTHLVQEFPEIIIQKDKAIVATSKQGSEAQAVYSVMAMVEHSGYYTCKVESNRISKASSILVNITELFPKPKLEFSSSRLDQGEMLDLFCSVPGTPSTNFTIQKEDRVLTRYQNFSKFAEERDSGRYVCTAAIGKVVKRSNSVQIKVCEMLSKPRIFHDATSEIIKGHAVGIACHSINGTTPITYHLIKATRLFRSVMMNSNDPATFTDKPTKDVEYQCIVDNCHSHPQLHSEILKVGVIAPVDEVTISILSSNEVQSGNEMVLRCSVKEGTGPITFRFYKEGEDRHFHEDILNDTQAFWYKKLASKEQEGQYYCTASNRASMVRMSPRSSMLTVRVFLAPWKKGLIAVTVIGVIIAALIVTAKCYFLKKAKAKQKPVEMSRPAAPLLNSNSEKVSESNVEANSHYGYDDVGNDAMKPINQNKDPQNMDVEYTEVQVSSPEPHQALGTKATETVYSEIRKADPNFMENRHSRTEGSLDGT